MIKAESLTRKYGSVVAVDDVSFQIEHGEIVGLLGHNGAGKTTIMKMLTGFLEPSGGRASIDGRDVWDNRVDVEKSIGYLPENCPIYPEMIVIDYLDYAATLRGVPEDKKVERIRYAIQKTRLSEMAEKPISNLSRGYRQRLGVAQAILNSPKILILDEPTNGLDPSQILEMRSLIKELAENATVLISTHILQEVQAVCGRVIIINRGKLALDGAMAALRASDRLVVATDAKPERANAVLNKLENVEVLNSKENGDQFVYTLELSGSQSAEIAPKVARALVENDMLLFALQPQSRDLETIFGEITSSGSTAVAANGDSATAETSRNGESATPIAVTSSSEAVTESGSSEGATESSPAKTATESGDNEDSAKETEGGNKSE